MIIRYIFISLPKGASKEAVKAAQEKIAIIKKELQKQTFSYVVKQYSEDFQSRQKDGYLGTFARGELPPDLEKVAFSLNIGDYTKEPIKTDAGLSFLKVEGKLAKKDIVAEENVKRAICIYIVVPKERKEHADELKAKANIRKTKI